MKPRIKNIALIAIGIVGIFAAFGFGYYRGSQDASLGYTTFYLEANEGLYRDLQKNDMEHPRIFLKTVIGGEARSLRQLDDHPWEYFKYQLLDTGGGDAPKLLRDADDITK